MDTAHGLGADIRTLRKTRGLTLTEVASGVSRSVGWMSQVERGLSRPSRAEIDQIAELLGVEASLFEDYSGEADVVVRKGARRQIGTRAEGLFEELLSPDLTDAFEVIHSTFAPGARLTETVTRPTQELGHMVSGKLDLTIGDQSFTVGPGDSFRIREAPYLWSNPYDKPAVAIWIIAPPVY